MNSKTETIQIKSKNNLDKIKSKYILKQVFDNLSTRISLALVKYNKNIKKKLNICKNDYKKYCEIKIEIKTKWSGKFINFINDEDEKFFHIYFEKSKEETFRNYLTKEDKVKKITVIIDSQIKSFNKLFYNCKCIKSINFKKFKRDNITNMSYMFGGCSSLKEINFLILSIHRTFQPNYLYYQN